MPYALWMFMTGVTLTFFIVVSLIWIWIAGSITGSQDAGATKMAATGVVGALLQVLITFIILGWYIYGLVILFEDYSDLRINPKCDLTVLDFSRFATIGLVALLFCSCVLWGAWLYWQASNPPEVEKNSSYDELLANAELYDKDTKDPITEKTGLLSQESLPSTVDRKHEGQHVALDNAQEGEHTAVEVKQEGQDKNEGNNPLDERPASDEPACLLDDAHDDHDYDDHHEDEDLDLDLVHSPSAAQEDEEMEL